MGSTCISLKHITEIRIKSGTLVGTHFCLKTNSLIYTYYRLCGKIYYLQNVIVTSIPFYNLL